MATSVTPCVQVTPTASSLLSEPTVACLWCGVPLQSSMCVCACVHICAHPSPDSAHKTCILQCSSGDGMVLSHCQRDAVSLKCGWGWSTLRLELSLWHRSPQKNLNVDLRFSHFSFQLCIYLWMGQELSCGIWQRPALTRDLSWRKYLQKKKVG